MMAEDLGRLGQLPGGCAVRCRACRYRHHSPEMSRKLKTDWLSRCLAPWSDRLASLEEAPESRRLGYREKICLRARFGGGRWLFGMLRGPDEFVPVMDCPVHAPALRERLHRLSDLLSSFGDLPLAFVAASGGLLSLVLKSKTIGVLESVNDEQWRQVGAGGIFANLNPAAGNRVFATRGWQHLWGAKHEERAVAGRVFTHGPESFQQLIPELYSRSVAAAADFLAPGAEDAVVDLYSGIGVTLRRWRERGADAIGVELSGEAVSFSAQNLGGEFVLRGRVEERLPQLDQWLFTRSSRLMYVNPPRLGLDPRVCGWISENARPERLAYLSCSAGTLARDLGALESGGYRVVKLLPYDFFPLTDHVETLALVERI